MKKFIIFSLSLLVVAGSVQPAFGMNGDEEISHARWTGAKNGFYAGLFSSLSFGTLTSAAGHHVKNPSYRPSPDDRSALSLPLVAGLVSLPVWSFGQSAFSQKLKETGPNITRERKKELKKQYHSAEFWTNSLTTAAVATTAYAAATAKQTIYNDATFGKQFLYALLPITASITAMKWMTYGMWRNYDLSVKNYNQKQQAYYASQQAHQASLIQQQAAQLRPQQAQRDLQENDPKSS